MSAITGPASDICSNCGAQNEPSRRFCGRCGQWLVTPTGPAGAAGPPAFAERWRRRWFGDRGPYTGRLSRATVGFRALVAAVGVVLVTAVLGLANLHPIQRVTDQIGHVRGTGKVLDLAAAVEPAGARPDPTADWAVDRVRARGWSTQWVATTAGDDNTACRSGAGAAAATSTSLAVAFPSALDVREIGFEAGLVQPAERTDRWQPRTLELRWKNGDCQVVNLENTPDLQRFGVHQEPTSGVLITIVAGYPPDDPGSGRLDIGELTIWKR